MTFDKYRDKACCCHLKIFFCASFQLTLSFRGATTVLIFFHHRLIVPVLEGPTDTGVLIHYALVCSAQCFWDHPSCAVNGRSVYCCVVIHFTNIPQFTDHSPVREQLLCPSVSIPTNQASVKAPVWVFLWRYVSIFLGKKPGSGVAEPVYIVL